jgi:hypothetical protein
LKNEACIIGVGQTELSRNSGRSVQRLAAEATAAALAGGHRLASRARRP